MITTATLVTALLGLLPTIADDGLKLAAVLEVASRAVWNAQHGDGTISAEDWAAINARAEVDLASLASHSQG
jgi:hypothetical protein